MTELNNENSFMNKKAIFYSDEFQAGFKFVEIKSKMYQEYINDGISYCETKLPTNLFLFFAAEGVTINPVDNYEAFKNECFKYYGNDSYTESKRDNYIDVHYNDDGEYGRFEYYENVIDDKQANYSEDNVMCQSPDILNSNIKNATITEIFNTQKEMARLNKEFWPLRSKNNLSEDESKILEKNVIEMERLAKTLSCGI